MMVSTMEMVNERNSDAENFPSALADVFLNFMPLSQNEIDSKNIHKKPKTPCAIPSFGA
ncbi:hypothetical protein [Paenibacillus silvisoli]|uniref:hypothetical protein n=1 Tax=Paenibacillus silvisoli TaxID=3110539 RepID=UPI002806131F|nr:hypothetical protein [Paenibacillus silvisoli]